MSAGDNRKTKAELITELDSFRSQLAANTAAIQLAVLQEIEHALARQKDLAGIYGAVGRKLVEVFGAQTVGFYQADLTRSLMYIPWTSERGEITSNPPPVPLNAAYRHVIGLGKTFVKNHGVADFLNSFEDYKVPYGELPKSLVTVPIIQEPNRWLAIAIQEIDREGAFSDEDVRLLEAIAATMGTALENARLFEETQQRNAELAVINSVQAAMSAELELKGIYQVVGEKVREIFDAQSILISIYDQETQFQHSPYVWEKGTAYELPPVSLLPLSRHLIQTRQMVWLNENLEEEGAQYGLVTIPGTENAKSAVWMPLIAGGEVKGSISLQNVDREHAFTENDVRLLQTLANSMAVALENARLFEETQQRNAELAVINSVQEGLATKLDMQAIYDLVGDKISEITGSEIVVINTWNAQKDTIRYEYIREKGERGPFIERPSSPLNREVRPILEAGQTIIWNDGMAERLEKSGHTLPAGEMPLTVVTVPIHTGDRITTSISLQDTRKEFAFDEATIRLVETLARSMGIALENARLFDETTQRNAELAVINSVQQGMAREMDFQGIIDLVGDKLRKVLNTQDIGIRIYDPAADILHFPYEYEHGERLEFPSAPPTNLSKMVLDSREPIFGSTTRLGKEFNFPTMPGTDASKAVLAVPILSGDQPRGLILVEDFHSENAYDESDVRLMETLAGSMGVALENARLFEELQTSNLEIRSALERQTATSEVLHIMANSPGEIQPVLKAVAEHAAHLCEADDVQVYQVDGEKLIQVAHFGPLPALDDGEGLPLDPGLATGRSVLEKRTIQMDAGAMSQEEYPISVQLQKRLKHRSVVMTPLLREDKAIGAIVARRNQVREFSEIEVSLLQTFADQAAIAIENVRLFKESERLLNESRQQAEELKTVYSVGQALSSELELTALIELIGSQVQQIFSADVAYVALLDKETSIIDFPYSYGEDVRPLKLGEGLTSRVIKSGEPVLINQDEEWDKTRQRIGVKSKSYLGVPIFVGKDVIGVLSVQSTRWTNMYGKREVRLLSTIAANVGAAIHNANLFEQVERQKVYFEALISSAPVAIVTIDLDGNVSGWSPAAVDLFGYSAEEAIGSNIDSLVANHPDVREEAESYTRENLGKDTSIAVKSQRTHKDGHLIDVAISAMPVWIEDQLSGYIAIYTDISELERARRAAEDANLAKSAFLANMSHELRTPLNAILGFTRIVKRKSEGTLPDKQIDNLDKVLVSAEHLLSLINTVLDISKIEAGRMDIHASHFELKPLLDLVLVTIQPLVRQGSVSLVSDVPAGLPALHTDMEKIKQVLINMLSNAAKFTHRGEIALRVRHEAEGIEIDVTDTGIGIPHDKLDTIFEEFQQADTSTTREYGGTGLGLAISRSLARLLGGDLTVSSELGKGSTFTFSFPAVFGQEPEPEPTTMPEFAGDEVAPLVLVIDDNPDAIYLMRETLDLAGYRVAVATNGEEGLRMARELKPFAITLDIMMPQKDGWQVLHDLKQDAATKNIPVIMISIVDRKALGYRLGAVDYLVKPFDEDQVLASLARLREQNGSHPLKRLLIVDDDPNVADMIRQLLEDGQYHIEVAEDGLRALEMIEASPPDVVLLDLMLPRLDGFGFLERLNQHPHHADLPVIVLTAKLLSTRERAALTESVSQVIQKQGFSGEALLAEIRGSISKAKTRDGDH
jgi:PAS domain S-box-containing protein